MPLDEPNEILQYIDVDQRTGAISAKPWRAEVMPFALYFDEQWTNGVFLLAAVGAPTAPGIYKLPHASVNPGSSHRYTNYQVQNPVDPTQWPMGLQSQPMMMNPDLDADIGNPLLIKSIVCRDNLQAGNLPNYTVMLQDRGDKTQFMNAPVHMQLLAGTSLLPGGLSEPLFLPTRHTLQATFVNLGIATAMRMILWGEMFTPWSNNLIMYPRDRDIMMSLIRRYDTRRKYVFPFWLTTELQATLLGYELRDFEGLVGDDAHFEATHLMAISAEGLAFEFEIVDPDTNQTISNGKFDSEAATGLATLPQKLPVPLLIPAGRRIIFRIKNRENAVSNIFIALRGKKIRAPFKDWKEVSRELEIPANPQQKFETRVSRPPQAPVAQPQGVPA